MVIVMKKKLKLIALIVLGVLIIGSVLFVKFFVDKIDTSNVYSSAESIIKEVSGDNICHYYEEYKYDDGTKLTIGLAFGLTFKNDQLTTVDRYFVLESDNVGIISSNNGVYSDFESVFNSYDGVKGNTTITANKLVLDYTFNLTKFDYKTQIKYGTDQYFSLPFVSLNKNDVLMGLYSTGLSCGDFVPTWEDNIAYYLGGDSVVDRTDYIDISSKDTDSVGSIELRNTSYNSEDGTYNYVLKNITDSDVVIENNKYFIEFYDEDKNIITSFALFSGIEILAGEEYDLSLQSEKYEDLKYVAVSLREYK